MIAGLGIDLVQTSRIRKIYEHYGERFARRILAPEERVRLALTSSPVSFLAMRFAAKEAASKALGLGFREGVSPRLIEVTHDERGKPSLRFHGAAEAHLRQRGIAATHVSLTDEAEYAAAVVVFETL